MDKKRILIVDDEADFNLLVKLNLEATGHYEVKSETHPERALPAARQFQPHLILLDVMMPQLNGGEVASRLRAEPGLDRIPILFLTAMVTDDKSTMETANDDELPMIAK